MANNTTVLCYINGEMIVAPPDPTQTDGWIGPEDADH